MFYMLLETVINTLTESNALTVLIEYIDFFDLNGNGNVRQIFWEELPYTWPYTTLPKPR